MANEYLQAGWVLLTVKIIQERKNVADTHYSEMAVVYILGKPRERPKQETAPSPKGLGVEVGIG